MSHHLTGKKILFIGTTYFQYNQHIVKELTNKGAIVEHYNDDPFDKLGLKNIRHRFPASFITRINKRYTDQLLKKIKHKQYDYLFVVRGESISPSFLKEFTADHPHCKKIMYQWDSLKNHHYAPLIPFFDIAFTFDRQDHEERKINYLPLFALEEFFTVREKRVHVPQVIDILFVGYNHSARIDMLRKLRKHFAGSPVKIWSHLYTPKFSYLKNRFKKNPPYKNSEVTSRIMSHEALLKILEQTKIVVDMQSATQKGLTIRTFESLAAGCHLMTTNKEIAKEPFFDSRYITLLDLDNIKLPDVETKSFIPFREYSLSNWLNKIFSEEV